MPRLAPRAALTARLPNSRAAGAPDLPRVAQGCTFVALIATCTPLAQAARRHRPRRVTNEWRRRHNPGWRFGAYRRHPCALLYADLANMRAARVADGQLNPHFDIHAAAAAAVSPAAAAAADLHHYSTDRARWRIHPPIRRYDCHSGVHPRPCELRRHDHMREWPLGGPGRMPSGWNPPASAGRARTDRSNVRAAAYRGQRALYCPQRPRCGHYRYTRVQLRLSFERRWRHQDLHGHRQLRVLDPAEHWDMRVRLCEAARLLFTSSPAPTNRTPHHETDRAPGLLCFAGAAPAAAAPRADRGDFQHQLLHYHRLR